MKGYKAVTSDMKAFFGTFIYEVGKTYSITGELQFCENGFHFGKDFEHALRYYNDGNAKERIFEIEASGKIIEGSNKCVAESITLVRELLLPEIDALREVVNKERIERCRLAFEKVAALGDKAFWIKVVDIADKRVAVIVPRQGIKPQMIELSDISATKLDQYYLCPLSAVKEKQADVTKLIITCGIPNPDDISKVRHMLKKEKINLL